jgi:hypothetical protein
MTNIAHLSCINRAHFSEQSISLGEDWFLKLINGHILFIKPSGGVR